MPKDYLIRAVSQQLRLLQQSVEAFEEAAAARLNLNRTDLRCLDLVLAGGPLAAGQITAGLGISPAATTTVIDRLARAGLVRREQDPANRRRVMVVATESARVREREVYHPLVGAGRKILERFDEVELATVLLFLRAASDVQLDQARRITPGAGPG